MHHNIAIVGAGITGIMSALACARKGASVDLYDAGPIPNPDNLSWAYGRLWKHIHENNPTLQPLAADSYAFWKEKISGGDGKFGCHARSFRTVDDATCDRLAALYQNASVGYELHDRAISAQNCLLNLERVGSQLFVGHDALLLNARIICLDLLQQLMETNNVKFRPHFRVDLSALSKNHTVYVDGKHKEYSDVILATSSSETSEMQDSRLRRQYQVHLDVHISDGRACLLQPVLDLGDKHQSWCVPSPDRNVLKVSASRFSFPEYPTEETQLVCKEYLLSRLRVGYTKSDVFVSSYFELPAKERLSSPYWHRHQNNGCIVIEACDASIFKVAPALSEQISQNVIHGVKDE